MINLGRNEIPLVPSAADLPALPIHKQPKNGQQSGNRGPMVKFDMSDVNKPLKEPYYVLKTWP